MYVIKIFKKIGHEFKWEWGNIYVIIRKNWTKEIGIT